MIKDAELRVDANYTDGLWSGTVSDPEGNKLPGANIVVVGTTRGSVTDFEGKFSITTSPLETLNINFVGYKSVRLLAKGNITK